MHRNILYFDDALRNGEAIHEGVKLSGFWEYRPLSRQHVPRASLKLEPSAVKAIQRNL